jgi:hypothetical protein
LFKPEITELREIVADEIAIVSLLPENSAHRNQKPVLINHYCVYRILCIQKNNTNNQFQLVPDIHVSPILPIHPVISIYPVQSQSRPSLFGLSLSWQKQKPRVVDGKQTR